MAVAGCADSALTPSGVAACLQSTARSAGSLHMAVGPVNAWSSPRAAMSWQLLACIAAPSAWIAATFRFISAASHSPPSFLPRIFMSISPSGAAHRHLAVVAVGPLDDLPLARHLLVAVADHRPGHGLPVVLDVGDLALLVAPGSGRLLQPLLRHADLGGLGGHGEALHLHLHGLLPLHAGLGRGGGGWCGGCEDRGEEHCGQAKGCVHGFPLEEGGIIGHLPALPPEPGSRDALAR